MWQGKAAGCAKLLMGWIRFWEVHTFRGPNCCAGMLKCGLEGHSLRATQQLLAGLVNAPADGSCSGQGKTNIMMGGVSPAWQPLLGAAGIPTLDRCWQCAMTSTAEQQHLSKQRAPEGALKSTRGCHPRHSAATPSSWAIRRSTGSYRPGEASCRVRRKVDAVSCKTCTSAGGKAIQPSPPALPPSCLVP